MALTLKVDPAEPHLVRSECRCYCTDPYTTYLCCLAKVF